MTYASAPKTKNHLKLYSLFGDGGRYAGTVNKCGTHDVYFSMHYFDDYISLRPDGTLEHIDRDKLDETVEEVFSGAYDAIACDAPDAMLLRFFEKKRGYKPVKFIINEVDMFETTGWVRRFINRSYNEEFFDEFLGMRENLWMYIISTRAGYYRNAGIRAENLFYLPMCTSSIEFTFPQAFQCATESKTANNFSGTILSTGTHDRDFRTLAVAIAGTGLEAHIITNLKMVEPFEAEGIVWHDSLPEQEYFAALKSAKLVIVPLLNSNRAAGQLACAVPMKFCRPVIAARVESVMDHIKHGETGFLYKPESAKSLRSVLRRALEKPQMLRQVGENAQRREAELSAVASESIGRLLERIKQG